MADASNLLTSADFPVDVAGTESIARAIKNVVDVGFSSRENPLLIVVVGQPASGKSRTVVHIQREYERPMVTLDSDELRLLHPRMNDIIRTDPYRMDVLSNAPVSTWMAALIEHCRHSKLDTIIENTLTNPAQIRQTARAFKDEGFTARLELLAVPEPVSRLGIVTRYLAGVDGDDFPRWTTEASHRKALSSAPEGVRQLESVFDEIQVRDRKGGALHTGTDAASAAGAFEKRLSEGLSPDQFEEWIADYTEVAPRVGRDISIVDRTRTVLRNLVADAEDIIPPGRLPEAHATLIETVRNVNS